MTPTNATTIQAPLPNPYALYTPLPQGQVALLFATALVCLALGLLLAQGRALRALLAALDMNLDLRLPAKSRAARAALGERV